MFGSGVIIATELKPDAGSDKETMCDGVGTGLIACGASACAGGVGDGAGCNVGVACGVESGDMTGETV